VKSWEKALRYKWQSRSSHVFLLYLNVADDVLNGRGGCIEQLNEHLVSGTVAGKARFIAFFNRGTGIKFLNHKMEKDFFEFLVMLHPEKNQMTGEYVVLEQFRRNRFNPAYALQLFGEMLEITYASRKTGNGEAVKSCPEEQDELKIPFFAAILDYIETLAPSDSATNQEIDRNALVTFLVWAKNKKISEAGNIVILVGESLGLIAPQLRSETNGIAPLKLYFPDLAAREKTIAFHVKSYPPHKESIDTKQLAYLSAGMSRNAIGNMIKEAGLRKAPLAAETVFRMKKKFIEEQSGGLLEIMQPLWGVEAIGGLKVHKEYIFEVVQAIKRGDFLAVPMGILLLGAPGTGKTAFAEAIAHEAGLPFVKLKNIREMWVGKSERNLDFALELIAAQAPVVVFVDEIDQEYQSRSTMIDNTGVNNRMQARLFQFMSDTNLRGRVLWLAASNMPNLLDPALLREGRFDERIPFFPPSSEERGEILPAILEKMKIQAALQKFPFNWSIDGSFFQEFGWFSHRHYDSSRGLIECDPDVHERGTEESDEVGLTGAQIETIVRKAYTLASNEGAVLGAEHLRRAFQDFIPGQDFLRYGTMTELALSYCNSERFIPEGKWKKLAKQLRKHNSQPQSTRIV